MSYTSTNSRSVRVHHVLAVAAIVVGCGDSTAPSLVSDVRFSLDSLTVVSGGQLYRPSTTVLDTAGEPVLQYPLDWRSTDTTKAVVDSQGIVTARAVGTVSIIVSADGKADTLRLTVSTVTLTRVTVGFDHACGLTPQGRAYCWGAGGTVGALGVPDLDLVVTGPVAVQGAPALVSITAGWEFACGITAGGQGYCWGSNRIGQLGLGQTDTLAHGPTPISGAHLFSSIEAGTHHACGIITTGAAYCWGYNGQGRNGNGADGNIDPAPVAVSGGLTFRALAGGLTHTCAIAADSTAYCWGGTGVGEVGAYPFPPECPLVLGSNHCLTPVPVSGGLRFLTLDVGSQFTCAIAADSTAYCWGYNASGGMGTAAAQLFTPALVPGGIAFAAVGTGTAHTCALSVTGAAYCWGPGGGGALGTGTPDNSTSPVPVTGGLPFQSLSLGGGTSCGVTLTQRVYCWGSNQGGVLGMGAYPVPGHVLGPTEVVGQP